jgi:hypothetical protein
LRKVFLDFDNRLLHLAMYGGPNLASCCLVPSRVW